MAYGRRTTIKRGAGVSARRRVDFRRKRASTKTTYRKLKRRSPAAAKYAVAKNTTTLRNLKTIVNQGPVQRNVQRLKPNAEGTGLDPPPLTPENNIFFPANDFTGQWSDNLAGGMIYINRMTPVGGGFEPDALQYGSWIHYSPGFQASLLTPFRQWTDPNIDTASYRGYMPMSARYSFNFRWANIVSTEPNITLRIDIIKPKKVLPLSQQTSYTLPKAGGALSNMALDQYDDKKNTYNPELWTVKTMYKTIPRADVPRTNVNKTMTFAIKFPRRMLDLKLQVVSNNIREQFWTNCPIKQQVWVNINISQKVNDGTSDPTINATRQLLYRDIDKGPE